jgi:hypothetical protein
MIEIQNENGYSQEREGLKYDDSHILITPVISELCFLLQKINFAAKNKLAPNRDVGGWENSEVVFLRGRHIDNKM